MIQSAIRQHKVILQFAQAALVTTGLFILSGCAVGHSMARSGSCGECGCAECALQHVGNGQYAASGPTSMNDYKQNYPYPSTAQNAPLKIPPQQIPAGQAGQRHQTPSQVPPEIPAANMHARTMPHSQRVSTLDQEARTECAQLKKQTAALQAQLTQLQTRITQDERTRHQLNQSLTSVNGKVSDLSSELHFWKQEVQRIDADAEAQHRDDMATLESISEIISQLPQPATASGEQPGRY